MKNGLTVYVHDTINDLVCMSLRHHISYYSKKKKSNVYGKVSSFFFRPSVFCAALMCDRHH